MDMLNESTVQRLEQGYQITDPFPFIVIDNFFKENIVNEIKSCVDNLVVGDENLILPQHWYHNKFAFYSNFGAYLENIFVYLNSDDFITYIEKLTGIYGIIRDDTTLVGAGIHRITNAGFLDIHTDFTAYNMETRGWLDRRINLLIYLNPEWKDEYGGHLWLCNFCSAKYKVRPLFNRAVIFNTTRESFHGHPEPLNVPDDVMRQSIAVYYYTKHVPPFDAEGKPPSGLIVYKKEWFDDSGAKTI
jgi:Rps23 Pro-64 3,4-dihydroxylase Tpa1-like proline 4-hydroxylase